MGAVDVVWLGEQGKAIHDLFHSLFFSFASIFLVLGVVLEYFKFPLGGGSLIPQLVSRVLIASIMLYSLPEVMNTLANVTDSITAEISKQHDPAMVAEKLIERAKDFNPHLWSSWKDVILQSFTWATFFLLYLSVHLSNAGVALVWTVLYVFSPLLIALYILPPTSMATKALYRSLIEVCCWKIVWSTLAVLLWSTALSQVNKPESEVNIITVVAYNLILAASLLMTPLVVNALASGGLSSLAAQATGIAAGASFFNPGTFAAQRANDGKKMAVGASKAVAKWGTRKALSPVARAMGIKLGDSKRGVIKARPVKSGWANLPTRIRREPPEWHADVPPPSEP